MEQDEKYYEEIRLRYDEATTDEQLELQSYYDTDLSGYWEELVTESGSVHHDDVDEIAVTAWEWYLEH